MTATGVGMNGSSEAGQDDHSITIDNGAMVKCLGSPGGSEILNGSDGGDFFSVTTSEWVRFKRWQNEQQHKHEPALSANSPISPGQTPGIAEKSKKVRTGIAVLWLVTECFLFAYVGLAFRVGELYLVDCGAIDASDKLCGQSHRAYLFAAIWMAFFTIVLTGYGVYVMRKRPLIPGLSLGIFGGASFIMANWFLILAVNHASLVWEKWELTGRNGGTYRVTIEATAAIATILAVAYTSFALIVAHFRQVLVLGKQLPRLDEGDDEELPEGAPTLTLEETSTGRVRKLSLGVTVPTEVGNSVPMHVELQQLPLHGGNAFIPAASTDSSTEAPPKTDVAQI